MLLLSRAGLILGVVAACQWGGWERRQHQQEPQASGVGADTSSFQDYRVPELEAVCIAASRSKRRAADTSSLAGTIGQVFNLAKGAVVTCGLGVPFRAPWVKLPRRGH
jgi:hypothetical protein